MLFSHTVFVFQIKLPDFWVLAVDELSYSKQLGLVLDHINGDLIKYILKPIDLIQSLIKSNVFGKSTNRDGPLCLVLTYLLLTVYFNLHSLTTMQDAKILFPG